MLSGAVTVEGDSTLLYLENYSIFTKHLPNHDRWQKNVRLL